MGFIRKEVENIAADKSDEKSIRCSEEGDRSKE